MAVVGDGQSRPVGVRKKAERGHARPKGQPALQLRHRRTSLCRVECGAYGVQVDGHRRARPDAGLRLRSGRHCALRDNRCHPGYEAPARRLHPPDRGWAPGSTRRSTNCSGSARSRVSRVPSRNGRKQQSSTGEPLTHDCGPPLLSEGATVLRAGCQAAPFFALPAFAAPEALSEPFPVAGPSTLLRQPWHPRIP